MQTLEKILFNTERLYKLIQKAENKPNIKNIGIEDTDCVDTRFDDADGFKVYHSDGYLFQVYREKNYKTEEDEVNDKWFWNYKFEDTHFDGFKTLTLEKAIELIEKEL